MKIIPHSRAGKPLVWDPAWRRFEVADWVVTGTGAALALAFAIVRPLPAPWRGGVLFDEGARDALRIKNADFRNAARDTSDVILSFQIMGPYLIDSLTTAYWYRGSKDVAVEMALIDLETMSVAAAVQGAMTTFTGRERPYGRLCGGELPANGLDCDTFGRFRSYFSGHTSLSFTSAALVCGHHARLNLFDDPTADALACVTSMLGAGATGALRVAGDQHYVSDVVTGAVVGTAVGFAVPYFLHYRRREPAGADRSNKDFTVHLVPTVLGASAVGTF